MPTPEKPRDRYFLGVMVPPPVRDQLFSRAAELTAPLRELSAQSGDPHRIDVTDSQDLHCTMLFLGARSSVDDVQMQMATTARLLRPVTVTVSGTLQWFGTSWVVPAEGLDELAATIVGQLGHFAADVRTRQRRFAGHVTLARVTPRPPDPTPRRTLAQPLSWRVHQLQLIRSRGRSEHPRYEVVGRAPLAG